MLRLKLDSMEFWDPEKEVFVGGEEKTVRLEHSLLAISIWESKYHKAFLTDKEKTNDELCYYIRCMGVDDFLDEETAMQIVYNAEPIQELHDYLGDPMTATVINKVQTTQEKSHDIPTSELIYYWMIASSVPFECERWNINRLLKLIEVCSVKNAPKKKTNKNDLYNRHRAVNAARRGRKR